MMAAEKEPTVTKSGVSIPPPALNSTRHLRAKLTRLANPVVNTNWDTFREMRAKVELLCVRVASACS